MFSWSRRSGSGSRVPLRLVITGAPGSVTAQAVAKVFFSFAVRFPTSASKVFSVSKRRPTRWVYWSKGSMATAALVTSHLRFRGRSTVMRWKANSSRGRTLTLGSSANSDLAPP
ncbi:hypothetical protein ACFFX0_25725 [Citricoccus parietis]|uniref:Secreted protein n=1 Tax=Citricoccus parietis TaxID=592307 RepID=A0ABV5G627_9MICC